MRTFEKVYGEISGLAESTVIELLEIQDKQDTRYSRVKTCKELWNHQQTYLINHLYEEINNPKLFPHDLLLAFENIIKDEK